MLCESESALIFETLLRQAGHVQEVPALLAKGGFLIYIACSASGLPCAGDSVRSRCLRVSCESGSVLIFETLLRQACHVQARCLRCLQE